jgi:hypothetical protein
MNAPLITVAAIIALALLYVLLPVCTDAYRRFSRKRVVTCPENKQLAEIQLDAPYAARLALVGGQGVRLKGCTRWPASRESCAANCLSQV